MFSKNERWNIYIYIKKYSCQWSAGIYYTNATSQIDFWLLGLDYVATTSVSGGTRKLCVQNQDCVLHCIWKKDCTISKLQTVMSLRSSELQGVSPNLASFGGIPQPRGFPRKGGFGEKRLSFSSWPLHQPRHDVHLENTKPDCCFTVSRAKWILQATMGLKDLLGCKSLNPICNTNSDNRLGHLSY